MTSLASTNKSFAIALKKYAEAVIKLFCSSPKLLDFFTCSKYFIRDCRTTLITTYNAFFSTQSCLRWYTVHNNLFKEKLESVQFNASLTLKGSITDTSRKKNYQKLRLESIRDERWCRKLSVFFKALKKKKNRQYLLALILPRSSTWQEICMTFSTLTQTLTFFKTLFYHQP